VLEYGKDMVIWTQREVPAAALQHSDLVFVGYGIVAPEYGWNDYAQVDVHGKTVVVMVGDPGYSTKDPKVFRGNQETYFGRWTYKVEEAARHGASGVLLIHDAGPAGYDWTVVVNDSTGPQLTRATPDGNAAQPAIEGGCRWPRPARCSARRDSTPARPPRRRRGVDSSRAVGAHGRCVGSQHIAALLVPNVVCGVARK